MIMSAVTAEQSFTYPLPRAPRPDFLKLGGIAAGMVLSLAATDEILTHMHWPATETEVVGEYTGWLVFGGLGETGGDRVIEELDGSLPSPLSSVHYSSRGVDEAALGQALASHYKTAPSGHEPQNLVTHSMGLPMSLEGMAWNARRGNYVPPVAEIHAISSPFQATDTHMEKALALIDILPWREGLATKLAVEFFFAGRRHAKLSLPNLGRIIRDSMAGSLDVLPPKTWRSMARIMRRTGHYEPGVFNNIITPDTNITYYRDMKDDVVRQPDAVDSLYQGLCEQYGAKLKVVETEGAGHANVAETRPYLARMVARKAR